MMKQTLLIVFIFCLIKPTVAFLFGDSSKSPDWNDLKVTWGVNMLSSWTFDSLPRDLSGRMKDFTLKDDQCAKGQNGKFLGRRYWYKNDPAVITLYDVNGYIAGIQTAIPKSSLSPSSTLMNHPVIDDGEYWTLTAYFVDPNIICSTGRTEEQFNDQGTGTGLWLQYGSNPVNDSVYIPTKEADIKMTKWTFGKCFYSMGNHYWYNVSADMPCGNFVPFCLMYNGGKLNAFCFAANADLPSKRYEHPTPKLAKNFINPVPYCFYEDPTYQKLSTIHVYFTGSPWTNLC